MEHELYNKEGPAMNANCFSLDMLNGLMEGFAITRGKPLPGTQQKVPHLRVGAGFVRRDNHDGCSYNSQGQLFSAGLRKIDLGDGKGFYTLTKPEGSGNLLLFVDSSIKESRVVKIKRQVQDLNLRYRVSGTAEIVVQNLSQSLVNFTEDGQELLVQYPTGLVHKVVRSEGCLGMVDLTPAEMAEVWVNEGKEALQKTQDRSDARRFFDGVMFTMIKLLSLTCSDMEARNVFVRFLLSQEEELSQNMRSMIKRTLGQLEDVRQFAFDAGDTNVVPISTKDRGVPAKRQQQKRERSLHDQALRAEMKGKSAGGGKKQSKKS